ncbi:MAG: hypothetical protein ACQEQF_01825 [Bacillota bacterium]
MSKQCPKCGAVFPRSAWKKRKSNYSNHYICPDCNRKLRWRNLKDFKRKK